MKQWLLKPKQRWNENWAVRFCMSSPILRCKYPWSIFCCTSHVKSIATLPNAAKQQQTKYSKIHVTWHRIFPPDISETAKKKLLEAAKVEGLSSWKGSWCKVKKMIQVRYKVTTVQTGHPVNSPNSTKTSTRKLPCSPYFLGGPKKKQANSGGSIAAWIREHVPSTARSMIFVMSMDVYCLGFWTQKTIWKVDGCLASMSWYDMYIHNYIYII